MLKVGAFKNDSKNFWQAKPIFEALYGIPRISESSQSSVCYHQLFPISKEETLQYTSSANYGTERLISSWTGQSLIGKHSDGIMTCIVPPKTPREAPSYPRNVTQPRSGAAARALQSLGKHSTDPQNRRTRVSQVRSSFSVQTPLDFALEVLSLPQWFVLPPSALQFHLLQQEELCLKPHKIQIDVTAESSHLLIGMRKGSRVKLILHFQLTNLELGCHRKWINSRVCSCMGRECAARTAPAVSEGLGSHLTLRAVPRASSAVPLVLMGISSSGHTAGSKASIICCRRQEFISHQIFFLVATWGKKKTGL